MLPSNNTLPRSGRRKETVRVEADIRKGEGQGFDGHKSNLRNEFEAVKAKAGIGHRFQGHMGKPALITVTQEAEAGSTVRANQSPVDESGGGSESAALLSEEWEAGVLQ